jgi:hypothetical protein
VTALNASTSSFTLTAPWWTSPINVLTTSHTVYQGFNPESFSSVAVKNLVSVDGFLFAPATGSTTPTLAAETVILRATGL